MENVKEDNHIDIPMKLMQRLESKFYFSCHSWKYDIYKKHKRTKYKSYKRVFVSPDAERL